MSGYDQDEHELEDLQEDYNSGFFTNLFDWSFKESITPTIIQVSYLLFMLLDVAVGIAILTADQATFAIRIVAAVVVFFALLILARLGLETIMTLHNIEEYTRSTSRSMEALSMSERNTRALEDS